VWRVAAIESRPTEGAAPPFESSLAPAPMVPTKSANKRMSHLADRISEEEWLDDEELSGNPFARAPLGWLKGLRALTGRVSENQIALSHWVGNLTSRFIKVTTGT
jgi:hypothetical protein